MALWASLYNVQLINISCTLIMFYFLCRFLFAEDQTEYETDQA